LVQLRFDLYVISCKLELVKIGVASGAQKRLWELQVGSAAVGPAKRRSRGHLRAIVAPQVLRPRQRPEW